MIILALDLARISGWCAGEPGAKPSHGSIQFAAAGSSHEAVFANAYRWMLNMIDTFHPSTIVWEAPLAGFKGGRTTNDVTTILFGLPAVIGAAAYARETFDCRKAETRDVRLHFIGANMKRAKAKSVTKMKCRAMGWDVVDDNAADACAVWHYMCSLISPQLAMRPTPLFGRRA